MSVRWTCAVALISFVGCSNDASTLAWFSYSLTLPDLNDPAGYTTFTANWSAP